MLLLPAETLLGLCNVIAYVIDKRGNFGKNDTGTPQETLVKQVTVIVFCNLP